MYRTFNMGIGMVIVMRRQDILGAQKHFKQHKIPSWVIGKITKTGKKDARVRVLEDGSPV